ncbi:MAG: hypothetical protein ACRDJU_05975 [Actinomycetota bacterium]
MSADLPIFADTAGNTYLGLEAGDGVDLVELLAGLLEVIEAPALAEGIARLIGADASLLLGDQASRHLRELATLLGSRKNRPVEPAPATPTGRGSAPTCWWCEKAMAGVGYRRYCSLQCRAAAWTERHPDRCGCGARLEWGRDGRCRYCQPLAGGPLRGEPATACPVCKVRFRPAANQRYCSKVCRDTAWRRRHQEPAQFIAVPDGRPRRSITVYECDACGTRSLGEQRCGDCGTFMRRRGMGGLCPSCDEPLAVEELLQGGDAR